LWFEANEKTYKAQWGGGWRTSIYLH
jgi:hypothetical protein